MEVVINKNVSKEDKIRITAQKEKGEIIKLVVQYDALIRNKWRQIVRYVSTSGFSHKDIIRSNGENKKQLLYFHTLNLAFTFAMQDIKLSWKRYRTAYERGLSK